jgi:hypothetical protein
MQARRYRRDTGLRLKMRSSTVVSGVAAGIMCLQGA